MNIKINAVACTALFNASLQAITYIEKPRVAEFLAANPGWVVVS